MKKDRRRVNCPAKRDVKKSSPVRTRNGSCFYYDHAMIRLELCCAILFSADYLTREDFRNLGGNRAVLEGYPYRIEQFPFRAWRACGQGPHLQGFPQQIRRPRCKEQLLHKLAMLTQSASATDNFPALFQRAWLSYPEYPH